MIGANLVLAAFLIMAASSTPATTNTAPEKVVESPQGSTPFIGEIIMFGGNFAPRGWAKCEGQLLPIAQYSALFSILGTTYGGDGRTTFALPDLRGRVAVGQGRGPGLSPYNLGYKGGSENVTLTTTNLPPHNHILKASSENANSTNPAGNYLGVTSKPMYVSGSDNTSMGNSGITNTGQGQPFNICQPYLTTNYIIALEGIYPSRS